MTALHPWAPWLAALCLAAAPAAGRAAEASARVPAQDVRVERHEGGFRVDVVMHTPVSPGRAWEVLTDFDHMVGVVPNLNSSVVVERQGLVWKVHQKGVARWGVFAFNFESLRELHLTPPREIRAHTLSGNVQRMDSVMQLEPEPGGTRLHYHAEVDPGGWFPPGVGPALVQHETAEQFSALLQDMARRP